MISRFRLGLLLIALALTARADLVNTNPPPTVVTNAATATNGDFVAPELHARSVRGQPAPRFEIDKWLGPAPSMQGKFVLIDFWATWCVPCRQSIPELNGFYREFKNRLVIVGVTDETPEEVRKSRLPHIQYSIASDPDERMMRALNIESLPHSILVDPSGTVRYEGSPLYLDEQKLKNLLDKYSK